MNGVAHVVINAKDVNINKLLIEKELADSCEENYMSKVRAKWCEVVHTIFTFESQHFAGESLATPTQTEYAQQ